MTAMIYGYARVSTDGQSVEAQVAELTAACASKVFSETASGARSDRAQLKRAVAGLVESDVLLITRLDRLARSTRDLLNVLAAVAERGAAFRSLRDAWADTTTPHGRLVLTVLGGLAEFERELIVARTSEGRGPGTCAWSQARPEAQAHPRAARLGGGGARSRREHSPPRPRPWRQQGHDRTHPAVSIGGAVPQVRCLFFTPVV